MSNNHVMLLTSIVSFSGFEICVTVGEAKSDRFMNIY